MANEQSGFSLDQIAPFLGEVGARALSEMVPFPAVQQRLEPFLPQQGTPADAVGRGIGVASAFTPGGAGARLGLGIGAKGLPRLLGSMTRTGNAPLPIPVPRRRPLNIPSRMLMSGEAMAQFMPRDREHEREVAGEIAQTIQDAVAQFFAQRR